MAKCLARRSSVTPAPQGAEDEDLCDCWRVGEGMRPPPHPRPVAEPNQKTLAISGRLAEDGDHLRTPTPDHSLSAESPRPSLREALRKSGVRRERKGARAKGCSSASSGSSELLQPVVVPPFAAGGWDGRGALGLTGDIDEGLRSLASLDEGLAQAGFAARPGPLGESETHALQGEVAQIDLVPVVQLMRLVGDEPLAVDPGPVRGVVVDEIEPADRQAQDAVQAADRSGLPR